jgi:DNA/RNA endonuclease G (NUC1)
MAKQQAIDPFDIKILKQCKGFNEKFIDGKTVISLDVLNSEHRKALPKVAGNAKNLLHYTDMSVWYNKYRKLPFVAAYNVDGADQEEVKRASAFKPDPRIDLKYQLGYSFYDLITEFTEFEIGHMASHNEMSWGSDKKLKALQTFHFTNSVPQVERLNSGLWGKLESYVVKEVADSKNKKISVFTGPMLREDNPPYALDKSFKVPLFFYKIIVFAIGKKLFSTAFVMSQYKRAIELNLIAKKTSALPKARGILKKTEPFSDYQHKEVFQVDIDMVENYTGLNFKWNAVNRIAVKTAEHKLEDIAKVGSGSDLKVRRAFGGPESADSNRQLKLNMIVP